MTVSGTEDVAGTIAMSLALEDANTKEKLDPRIQRMQEMSQAVWQTLLPFVVTGVVLPTGPVPWSGHRAPHIVSFCVRNVHRNRVV